MAAQSFHMREVHVDANPNGGTQKSTDRSSVSKALLSQMAKMSIGVRPSSRGGSTRQSKSVAGSGPNVRAQAVPASGTHGPAHEDQITTAQEDQITTAQDPQRSQNVLDETVEQALRLRMRRDALIRTIEAAVPLGRSGRYMPYPETLIPMRSQEGLELLEGSVGRIEDIVACFQGQGPLQCAVTSLTVALNFLRRPHEPKFTVHGLQEELRLALRPMDHFFSVQLGELATTAQRYASVQLVYASDSSADKFRRLASEALEAGGAVIVNFSRSAVGYASHFSGHCSPLGAYNPVADQFLVMDVAMRTWQPCWIPAELLFDGMNTTDRPRDESVRGTMTRGFMLLHPRDSQAHA